MSFNIWSYLARMVRGLFSLIIPALRSGASSGALYWVVHVLLVGGILFLLYWFQPDFFASLGGPGWFKPFWLPTIFFLLYLLVWAGLFLWRAMRPEEQAIPYPDLDDSWRLICEALERVGIGFGDTPVYVVMCHPGVDDRAFFKDMPGGLAVDGVPAGGPLRCYATAGAIYLVCDGVTVMSRLNQAPAAAPMAADLAGGSQADMGQSIGLDQSLDMVAFGEQSMDLQSMIADARKEGRRLDSSDFERLGSLPQSGLGSAPAPKGSILDDRRLIAEQTDRMDVFAQMLIRRRTPYCPLNGVVIVMAENVAGDETSATQAGLVTAWDLNVLTRSMGMYAPVWAVVTGLEGLPGAREYFDGLAEKVQTSQRLGKAFPVNPDLPLDKFQGRAEQWVQWILGSLIPYWGYKACRLGSAHGDDSAESLDFNGRLLTFLNAVRGRIGPIARMVSRAVVNDSGPTFFGGVYFTAERDGRAWFSRGLFQRIDEGQGYVTWTDEAFAQDARSHRLAYFGYAGFVGLMALSAAALVYAVYSVAFA